MIQTKIKQFVKRYNLKKESKFLKDIFETVFSRILLIVVGLISSIIVARALGPEGRGLFAIAGAIGAIGIQFGNIGIHSSNTYYVSKDRALLPILIGNSLLISFLLGVAGSIIAYLLFYFFPIIAPIKNNDFLTVLALSWIPIGLCYLLLQNLLIGIGKIRSYNLIEITTKVIYTLMIVFLYFLTMINVYIVYITVIITGMFGLLWAFYVLLKNSDARIRISKNVFNDTFKYGIRAYFVSLFSFLVLKIDLLMVNGLTSPEEAGYYSIAVALSDYVYLIPVVVATILFPKLSSMENNSEKWKFTRKNILFIIPLLLFISIIAGLFAEFGVTLLFGDEFLPAVPAFIWLLPAIIFLSINTILMNYFASLGMPLVTLYSSIAALLLNVTLNYILIPSYGIVGASISSVFAYGLMLVISCVYVLFNKTIRCDVEK